MRQAAKIRQAPAGTSEGQAPAVSRQSADVMTSADTPCDVSSLGVPCGSAEHELPSMAPRSSTTLRFLFDEHDALLRRSEGHLRRAERYVWCSIAVVLMTVIEAVVMSGHVPGPWWTNLLSAPIVTPFAGLARFFQNRYKEDLHELERLREKIVQMTNGV
jgi:hypothetical protein